MNEIKFIKKIKQHLQEAINIEHKKTTYNHHFAEYIRSFDLIIFLSISE